MFALTVRKIGRLYKLSAFYESKSGQTTVTSSWHADRCDALHFAAYLFS